MLSDETKDALKFASEYLTNIPNLTATPKQLLDGIWSDPRVNQNEKTIRVLANIKENFDEAEHFVGCCLGLNG